MIIVAAPPVLLVILVGAVMPVVVHFAERKRAAAEHTRREALAALPYPPPPDGGARYLRRERGAYGLTAVRTRLLPLTVRPPTVDGELLVWFGTRHRGEERTEVAEHISLTIGATGEVELSAWEPETAPLIIHGDGRRWSYLWSDFEGIWGRSRENPRLRTAMTFTLPTEAFLQMVSSEKLEGEVGPHVFTFGEELRAAMREIASSLRPVRPAGGE